MHKDVDKMKYLGAVQFNKIEVAILESIPYRSFSF